MKAQESKIFQSIRSHLIITFGVICITFGWTAFLIPSDVTGGGTSGIAALIYFATGFPTGLSYLILNGILILIAIKVVNLKFALRSVFGVLVFSLFLGIFQSIFTEPLVNDTLLASIIGAILSGLGSGIIFTQGGSTGGSDLIAQMISTYRNVSPGRIILMIDIIIISASFLIVHSLERVIYGYCVIFITTYVIDFVLSGAKQSYQIFIISNQYEAVAKYLSENINRGITLIDAQGWYTKKATKIIMLIVRKNEVTKVLQLIKQVDTDAFLSMGNVMGVYGKGFDQIKGKKK